VISIADRGLGVNHIEESICVRFGRLGADRCSLAANVIVDFGEA